MIVISIGAKLRGFKMAKVVKENRTARINIRFTETERKIIEKLAEKENRTPTDFCRSVVLEAIKENAGK